MTSSRGRRLRCCRWRLSDADRCCAVARSSSRASFRSAARTQSARTFGPSPSRSGAQPHKRRGAGARLSRSQTTRRPSLTLTNDAAPSLRLCHLSLSQTTRRWVAARTRLPLLPHPRGRRAMGTDVARRVHMRCVLLSSLMMRCDHTRRYCCCSLSLSLRVRVRSTARSCSARSCYQPPPTTRRRRGRRRTWSRATVARTRRGAARRLARRSCTRTGSGRWVPSVSFSLEAWVPSVSLSLEAWVPSVTFRWKVGWGL